MHREVLTERQKELLPLLKIFSKEYYLAGGTAIALHIGHRRSIDFDLFSEKDIKRESVKNAILKNKFSVDNIIYEEHNQLHVIVNSAKMTFYKFPHEIKRFINFNNIIKTPNLLGLSAIPAYVLGGRAKWKDYVDLYFILKYHYTLKQVSLWANQIFKTLFNEKLFREQLTYFKDIDYTEAIEYMQKEIKDDDIRKFLTETAISRI